MTEQATQRVIKDSVLLGLFTTIRTYQFGQSRETLAHIEEAVWKSLPILEERKALAAEFIALLEGESSADAKEFACRQLAILDATEAVPSLASLLDSEGYADVVLQALESITHISAGKALREALDTTTGLVRVGVINALGRRKDHPSVTALGAMLLESDPLVSEAAARALGMIRGTSAYMALSKAHDKVTPQTRRRIGDALLACAEDLMAQVKFREAEWIYRQLVSPAEAVAVRKAAQLGLERIKG